jgi:hypothetical protein
MGEYVMQWLENAINWVSDQDWAWWPMLFLRPAKNEVMTTARIWKIAVYVGTLTVAIVALPYIVRFLRCDCVLFNNPQLTFLAFTFFIYTIIFIMYRFMVATAWNRRALRLQKQKRKPDDSESKVADNEIELQSAYGENNENQQRRSN